MCNVEYYRADWRASQNEKPDPADSAGNFEARLSLFHRLEVRSSEEPPDYLRRPSAERYVSPDANPCLAAAKAMSALPYPRGAYRLSQGRPYQDRQWSSEPRHRATVAVGLPNPIPQSCGLRTTLTISRMSGELS